MEEIRVVARVIYEAGPYSDVWRFIEVGFGDSRFREPVSLRFLDEDDLPEGKGGTDYSGIPTEIRDQLLRMASKTPPRITTEEWELGVKHFNLLDVANRFWPEGEFTHEILRTALIVTQGTSLSLRQLREITTRLVRAGFLSEKEEGRKKGQFTPHMLKLTQKGLNFLEVRRGGSTPAGEDKCPPLTFLRIL